MSDSDRASYYYVQEATYGTTPASAAFLGLRVTSDNLAFEPTTVESQELDAGGQVTDLILVNQRAAGTIPVEFSFGSFDNQLANLLRTHSGTGVGWAAEEVVGPASTISFTATDTIADSGNGLGGLDVGQWIKVTGAGAGANENKYFKILTVAAGSITVEGTAVATQGAGGTVTITQGSYIQNGTTLGSETILRRYDDLGTTPNIPVAAFTGMTPDTFELNMDASALVTGTFGYIGAAEASLTDGTASSGTPTYAVSPGDGNTPFNASSNVIEINVASGAYPVRSLRLAVANGVRAREQVGTLGAASLGLGKHRVTLDLEAYYNDDTEYAKFLANSLTDAWWVLRDTGGNEYLFDVPAIKYANFRRNNPGTGQDIIGASSGTCIADAVAGDGKTLRIAKF